METILIFTNKIELSDYSLGDFEIDIRSIFIKKPVDGTKQIIIAFDGKISETINIDIAESDIDRITLEIPVGNLYLLHHSFPNNDTIEKLKDSLIRTDFKVENIHVKSSQHYDTNTYGLIKNIGNGDNGKLNKAFESFKLAIAGDPYLESLIKLHKTLSISLISNPRISIQDLKNNDKYKLAFELLNGETNIEKILKETPSKILERSKS